MNNHRGNPVTAVPVCVFVLSTVLAAVSARAQTPGSPRTRGQAPGVRARSAFPWPLMPGALALTPAAGPNLPVFGGGTLGRVTKWTGFGSSCLIGDSTIFEDKFGKVGIGTDSPTSQFTVAGFIET